MAGLIKTQVQLGNSGTAANNFVLTSAAADGTMKLARGNNGATTQDIVTVDASGVVDHPQGLKIAGVAGQRMLLTASQATTAGTAIDFTGIPSWAKKITVVFSGVSLSGNEEVIVQLGQASGPVTTGYLSSTSFISSAGAAGSAACSIGFRLSNGGTTFATAARLRYGALTIFLLGSDVWACTGGVSDATGNTTHINGAVPLDAVATMIRLTTATSAGAEGTNTFDAGFVSLLIEGY